MATEFPDLDSDRACVNDATPTAANAAVVLQLAEEQNSADDARCTAASLQAKILMYPSAGSPRAPVPSLNSATANPALPPNVRAFAVATIADAMIAMAAAKNVPMTHERCVEFARGTVDAFDASAVYRLLDSEPGMVARAARTINRVLDTIAAARVIHFVWEVEGFDQLDMAQINVLAQAWVRNTIVNDSGDTRYRWPDPADMVIDYHKTRASGPVAVRYPTGQRVNVVYLLDRPACRNAARTSKKPAERLAPRLTPLLIHYPGLPGMPGQVMPNGRLVKKPADSAECITWWRNGKLHRDPSEGPARHFKSSDEEWSEYYSDGKLHRDPEQGPAAIAYDRDGVIVDREYWVNGGKLEMEPVDG
jgi:hypothetical protein